MSSASPTRVPQASLVAVDEFVTSDPEEGHAFLTATYTESHMRMFGARERYRLRHQYRDAGRFAIATMEHSMGVQHDCDPLGYLLLARVLDGRIEVESDGYTLRAGPGDVFRVAAAESPYVSRFDRLRVQLLTVHPAALTDAAQSEVVLTGHRLTTPLLARQFGAVVDYIDRTLFATPSALNNPLLVGAATRLLAGAVVTTFPRQTDEPAPRPTDRNPAVIRRAVAFLEEHAHDDIGLAEIAGAAGVTPRAVQFAFRRHLDTTPTAYLRKVRLHRAHDDLVAGDPTRDSVAATAERWGFGNPGRFAAAYRDAFGCSPRETLHS